MINKLLHRIKAAVVSQLYYNTNLDVGNSILVAGSARTGTTWLAELVNQHNEFRLIFEPFLSEKVEVWRSYPVRYYADSNTENKKLKQTLEYILSGQIKNKWTDGLNHRIRCDKRIIKAVRANLLLPFILKNFPELKILFIHRNPVDVIRSRLSLGWAPHLSEILEQQRFIEKYYPGHSVFLHSLDDPIERQAAFWAVENIFVFDHLQGNPNILIIDYDKLHNRNASELKKINEFLSLSLKYISDTPSQSARTSQKTILSPADKEKIHKVVARIKNRC